VAYLWKQTEGSIHDNSRLFRCHRELSAASPKGAHRHPARKTCQNTYFEMTVIPWNRVLTSSRNVGLRILPIPRKKVEEKWYQQLASILLMFGRLWGHLRASVQRRIPISMVVDKTSYMSLKPFQIEHSALRRGIQDGAGRAHPPF